MGFIRDIVKSADQSTAVSEEIKETLHNIMALAESKAATFDSQISNDLITGKTGGDTLTIPITKVIAKRSEYRAKTSVAISDFISKIAESFKIIFSGDGNVANGIASILNEGLKVLLGVGYGEEMVQESYFVTVENGAIVRYDIRMWSRAVRATSIRTHVEVALSCVAFKSAVDVSKLDFNTFLSLYGSVLGKSYPYDNTKVLELVKKGKELYQELRGELFSALDSISLTPEELKIINNTKHTLPPIKTQKVNDDLF